jgi:hypothetical protein
MMKQAIFVAAVAIAFCGAGRAADDLTDDKVRSVVHAVCAGGRLGVPADRASATR